MESALEKVRSRTRRRSVSERRQSGDSGRRLSTLIPGRKKSKMRSQNTSPSRGWSPSHSNLELPSPSNRSETSLDLQGSGSSSILTDENLDSPGRPERPTLSPHPSHLGYLTLTSPEIVATQPSPPGDASSSSIHTFASSTPNIPHIVEPVGLADTARFENQRDGSPFDDSRAPSSRSNGLGESSAPPSQLSGSRISDQRPTSTTAKADRRPRVLTGPLTLAPSGPGTPQTLVTPPTPTDLNAEAATFSKPSSSSSSPRNSSPTVSLGSALHRRAQSANVPSKLSQFTAPPLTPTTEEVKTPGGTLTTGFFSSFFNAAQKATDQFNFGASLKGKSGNEVVEAHQRAFEAGSAAPGTLSSTVKSLGNGELNFSDLGIADSSSVSSMGPNGTNGQTVTVSELARAEEEAANRAVSAAYEKEPPAPSMSQVQQPPRPVSIASTERLTLGEQSPSRAVLGEGIQRSGSVHSALSGRRRRHRGSSATAITTASVGGHLTHAATEFASPSANGGGHRLTGFAVASSKRNRDFHQLFRSVPEDDYLIEDYSAAFQRDILLHGRLYISEGHICFSSNILGWVTNLVISFDEVMLVEKKSTAVIFPNAIVIQTPHARNTFASLVARDSTYELLIGIWKMNHPNLKSSLNGVALDDAGLGDKTELAGVEGSEGDIDDTGSDDVYDEDEDDDGGSLEDAATAPSVADSDLGDTPISRKPSRAALGNGPTSAANGSPTKEIDGAEVAAAASAAASTDFPGPSTHQTTQCADEHYERPIAEATIPAPLGKIYSLMFGPASGAFMKKWLVDDQKSRELNYEDDKTGIDNEHRSFTFDYIKPLYNSIGPKQTKCITTNNILAFDLEKAVSIDCSTSTPDVPNGNVFVTKTRYCLMWASNNSTRLVATCTIEWSGKSWIKGAIEKGANDGQIAYVKDLIAALNQAIANKSPTAGGAAGKKGKRKGKHAAPSPERETAQRGAAAASAEKQRSDWGLFEPIHGILGPLVDFIKPFTTPHVIVAVLFVLLVYTLLHPPRTISRPVGLAGPTSADRLVAYEEIWRREESNLWDWLEERVGLEGGYAPVAAGSAKQKVGVAKGMEKQLEDEKMSERQMDDAIRVTEERLLALKEAVARKKRREEL